jgi:PAS domain S-box-containing protein
MKGSKRPRSPASPRQLRGLQSRTDSYRGELNKEKQRLDAAGSRLRQSYVRYNDLYELAPVAFLTLDRAGCISELNDKAARLLSFPQPWLVGKPFIVFVARSDMRRFLTHLGDVARTGEQQTLELDLSAGDRIFPVQISTKTSRQGDSVFHILSVVDLTDIKRTERQLQDSLSNWHSLVQNAPEVIVTLDKNGIITFVNRPAWGNSVKGLIGTPIAKYVPESDHNAFEECVARAFNQNEQTRLEVAGIQGNPESWFSFSFGPLEINPGNGRKKTKYTTIMIRDISEQKRAERLLRSSGDQLREFAARLEAVREEERTRVAREIHDELGQALTVLKLDLSWLESKIAKGVARNKMRSVLKHVDETIESVRRISAELRPPMLDDLGLIPAIEWQLAQFQKRTRIRCKFHCRGQMPQFPPETAAAIFRVAQEALTNVMRHANASLVNMRLIANDRGVRLSIADDGKGITETQLDNSRSLGIVGMKERILRVGGELQIHSGLGKGTRLEINLPNL